VVRAVLAIGLGIRLGIGANTALFSVVNAVLLRPFPYGEPERLVTVWERNVQMGLPYMFAAPPNYADWQQQSRVFESLAAFAPRTYFLAGTEEPVRLHGARVTASLLPLLQVQPLLGRSFAADEEGPGAPRVVLLSHDLWQRQFAGGHAIVGGTILLNDEPHTVIGVMPPGFNFPPPIALEDSSLPRPADLWVPFDFSMAAGQRGAHFMTVLGRLKPGVSAEAAESEMNSIAGRLAQEYPETNRGWDVALVPLDAQVLGDVRLPLLVLMGAVGFVLLIACANVANLLLARASDRQKEFATRTALGASAYRLGRQLLTEGLLLALAGAAAGFVLGFWSVELLVRLAPPGIPRLEETSVDLRVGVFTLGIAMFVGLLFALAPAVKGAKADLMPVLRQGGWRSSGGSGRLRNALVVAEVSLALVLLIGAGLLLESFRRLRGVDTGFRAENVGTLRLTMPAARYTDGPRRIAAFRELESRINALPPVEAAGFVYEIPLAGDRQGTSVEIEGEAALAGGQGNVNFTFVTPSYFRAMGVPLTRGREFSERDTADSPLVVIVNETFAERFFPGGAALGRRMRVGFDSEAAREIVGVVRDVRHSDLRQPASPNVYLPYFQVPWSGSMSLAVRARGNPAAALGAVREQVRAFDRTVPLYDAKLLGDIVSESIAQPRFSTVLLGLFAALALTLGAVGIYGVISYSVTQRTHELGIRMALGAQRSDIFRLVIGEGMRLAALGTALGLAASLGVVPVLRNLLFGVSPHDPLLFSGVSLVLLAVAFAACWIPARRATRVDPMVALRYE
jgi:putative ABC transport system permease protein